MSDFDDTPSNAGEKLAQMQARYFALQDIPAIARFGPTAFNTAARAIPFATRMNSLSWPALGGYYGTKYAVSKLPQSWQDAITDNVGGTINSALHRVGGGVDDGAYLQTLARQPLNPTPPTGRAGPSKSYVAPSYEQPTPSPTGLQWRQP